MGRLKRLLIQYLVKNLLKALTEEDIITMTNRGWFLKNRKLSGEEVTQIKEEAHSFGQSVLWKLIANEIRYDANLRMFEKSAEEGNSVFGRAMLYNLELIEKFINRCTKL